MNLQMAELASNVKGFAAVTYDGMNEVGNNWDTNVDTDVLWP